MKKALIGTSALLAVGLLTAQGAQAADRISLGISGNYRVLGGFVNQDDGTGEAANGTRDHGIGADGKINFSGSTTLDNGIEVGVRVELEAQTVADQIDEHYIWIENTDVWGRIEMGDRDGAGNKMVTLGPLVFGPAIVGLQTMQLAQAPTAANGQNAGVPTVLNGLSGDSTKITYFTPRFSGVQLGISYTPESTENLGGNTFGAPIGGTDNTATDLSEIMELGANWNGNLGDAAVRASASYATADAEAAAGTSRNDRDEWSIGFQASMMGWAFGGHYVDGETNGGQLSTTQQRDDIEWRAGLTYSTGPWLLGLEYATRQFEDDATGEDEVEVWGLGAKRTLGPGVTAGLGIHMWDWEDDDNAALAENDATEIFFVTEISF